MSLLTSIGLDIAFVQHCANWGLSYGTKQEYMFRQDLWKATDKYINEINADQNNTFSLGHNMFSTYTTEEKKKLLGAKVPQEAYNAEPTYLSTNNLASSLDWRARGAVNPVKNQGQCGSCWAFSATCAIEGAHFLKTGSLLSFAEQELVDCDTQSSGCSGGWQSWAMQFVEQNGQTLETAYPYTARNGSCKKSQVKEYVEVTQIHTVPKNSGDQLIAAINAGPTSVTVDAEGMFMQYSGGIINSSSCGTSLDHAIAAVGYGTESGQQYYIVRNSWGTSWGESGYVRIAYQASGPGICGIQQVSVYPNST